MSDKKPAKVRLDKWLWAARFFKTRALAKAAIEGGKVLYDGQRCKVSRTVDVGATLQVRQGYDDKIITVLKISEQRKGAADAQLLYEETAASIKKRMDEADRRRKFAQSNPLFDHKPNKKERRQISKFKDETTL
ncbi:ribosome-associated heat shock protein Hsp15 [Oceaniserpentilla sp. 4NH20-0058]|uniref:RNA-binding S4 domain-containing protein n=1 Tax=Oceaniserpentilla sp. 4NH20-0058 TaxID=3127660 RepID=UPI0031067406